MEEKIAGAILKRIDSGEEKIHLEEIAEEVFGVHYAASDHHAAVRLEEIQSLLNETDWNEIPEGSGARWYWERALEQFRAPRPKSEHLAVLRAMRRVASQRPDFDMSSSQDSTPPNSSSTLSRSECCGSALERRRR